MKVNVMRGAMAGTKQYCFELRDGRSISWYEFGEHHGIPCLYFTGTPTGALAGVLYDDSMRRAGIRWISVDKPGYGESTPKPNRKLLEWPDDVDELVRHLRLERFFVIGESGGGPHALAVCYRMPEKILTGILLSSIGPFSRVKDGRGMPFANQLMYFFARYCPSLLTLPAALMQREFKLLLDKSDGAYVRMLKRVSSLPIGDRQVFEDEAVREVILKSALTALNYNQKPAIEEMSLLTQPWGFDLSDIHAPIYMWHGTEDRNVPLGMAQYMADRLPNCTPNFVKGSGHFLSLESHSEIISVITNASKLGVENAIK